MAVHFNQVICQHSESNTALHTAAEATVVATVQSVATLEHAGTSLASRAPTGSRPEPSLAELDWPATRSPRSPGALKNNEDLVLRSPRFVQEDIMKKTLLKALVVASVLSPAMAFAQTAKTKPTTATYITKEEIDAVSQE